MVFNIDEEKVFQISTAICLLQFIFDCVGDVFYAYTGYFGTYGTYDRKFKGGVFPFNEVPINFPLWFLRDLIFIFILSPILVIMLKEIPYFSLVLLGVIWMWHGKRHGLYAPEPFFWFYLGAVIKYKKIEVKISQKTFCVVSICYIIITSLLSYLTFIEYNLPYYKFIYNLNILLGIIILYYLSGTKFLQNGFVRHFTAASFFIYLFHEPVLSLTQYFLCEKFMFSSFISQLVLFFGSAIFVFLIVDTLYGILFRIQWNRIKEKNNL